MANQKHYQDLSDWMTGCPLSRGLDLALGSDMSLEWNFCACFLDVISWETSSGGIAKFWPFSQVGWPAVDTYLISFKKICSGNVE